MASTKASISKASKKLKINIIPPKQLFVDLTHDDTKTPSPILQLSSPSAPNAPSKTPSTKDTSLSSIDYIPKSPISSTSLSPNAGITDLKPYSTYSNPQGFIYVDKLGRNRLMCSHELYKFRDSTLTSVRDTLKDMANNLEMVYTSVMPRRRWSNLDKKRSRIMIKDIDR
ncbi:hypothetical protein Tco_0953361 [Tanacetum coccineum]|uniref:Uncharacterized protein n=1 Tax=Tanacetum coccineum TaxID=301880 RepID=A0ABQ5DZM9_9ASTR